MSEKKKTTKSAKIIPLKPKPENRQFSTMNQLPTESNSSKVFFDVLLQIDQMLATHFQDSTKVKEGK